MVACWRTWAVAASCMGIEPGGCKPQVNFVQIFSSTEPGVERKCIPNYQRYLAKWAKRSQDASNQLPETADVSIHAFDEKEPEVRYPGCGSCLFAADRRVATGGGSAGWTLLPVHVPFGG
jgi:hypothetical protein